MPVRQPSKRSRARSVPPRRPNSEPLDLNDGMNGLDDITTMAESPSDDETPQKRRKTTESPLDVPRTRRPTAASHRIQQKKLSAPFRSPLMKLETSTSSRIEFHPSAAPAERQKLPEEKKAVDEPKPKEAPLQGPLAEHPIKSLSATPKTKDFTFKASSQFKSPLSGSNIPSSASGVRFTPTIQSLERKLQALRRAVKIKQDKDEDKLEGLVKKWKEAGRDAAWEVWGLVKDNAASSESGKSRGAVSWGSGDRRNSGFQGEFGWDDGAEKSAPGSWDWDDSRSPPNEDGGSTLPDVEMEEEERKPDTLGTMLRKLGIAPETLGWDEDEGDFVGE
ncbi:hypothetical protein JAAARDRAFT_238332 [Jaapia argillacea MUCL 33604]|uniref:Swi5-dependent recombination DNA repair protein 1 homolog n=1 Tax=Jaapia argillacea MUCL 33604 TaxID=933084 RepID=A0A067QF64_9AGAM|nr:hypothetical protein JAAARDRAFT_238332 [Jaapia argillacea MUCL 33604]